MPSPNSEEPKRPLPDQAVCGMRVWIRKRPFWWSAIDPDETLATVDTHTVYRAWTRDGLVAKLRKRFAPKSPPWEKIDL